jgi:RNA polymerase sigma-70 factor (ECF subfamily)
MATGTRTETDDRAEAGDPVRRLLAAGLPQARRLAMSILRDPHAAEDAVQEAAAQAWGRRRDLRDPAAAEAWFARILTNVCRKQLTRASRQVSFRVIEPATDGYSERTSQWDEVARSVAQLRPEEQVVLGLRYGRDMTVAQIAACVGTREGTVKSRLHSAHEHLRAIIDAERRSDKEAVR